MEHETKPYDYSAIENLDAEQIDADARSVIADVESIYTEQRRQQRPEFQ